VEKADRPKPKPKLPGGKTGGLGALLKMGNKKKEVNDSPKREPADLGIMIEAQNRHNCLHYVELMQ
jgi:hypothetical protein